MKRFYFLVLTVVVNLTLTIVTSASDADRGKATMRDDASLLDQLRRLAKSDPVTEFAEARKKGDMRFLAIMGYAKVVPGVPDYDRRYAKSIGTKLIPGTTDAITSAEQGKVLEAVQLYAEKYNRLILAWFDKHPPKRKK